MAQSGSFLISVGLVDNASKGLMNLNKQIAAARRPMDNLQKQMDRFGKLTGLSKLKEGTQALVSPLTRVTKLMGGMFGMGSIAAIIATTRQFAELSNEIMRTSSALGISVDKLQQLRGAGTILGTGPNSLGNVLQTTQNNRLALRFGGDGDLQTLAQKAGLNANMSDQAWRDRSIDFVHGIRDPAIARQAAQKLIGTTDYMGMTSKQVHDAEATAKRLGRYSEDNVKNTNQLRAAYKEVNVAVNGVTQTIIGKLSPVLTPLLHQFAEWLASPDGTKMINDIVDGVKQLVEWLKQVDWKGIGHQIKEWYDWIGGFKRIVELLVAINLFGWFIGAGVAAVKFASALITIKNNFTKVKAAAEDTPKAVTKGMKESTSATSKLGDEMKKIPNIGANASETKGFLGYLGKVSKMLGRISGLLTVVTTGWDLWQDSKIKDAQDRHKAYTETLGGTAGAIAGGAAGAAIGSVILPGVGTAIGGVVGGIGGYYGGGALAKKGYDYVMGRHADITTAQQSKNINYLYGQLHKDMPELSENALYGILGNIGQESSFDPRVMGDHGHAHGLLQWQTARVNQLKKAGFDVTDGTVQTNEKAIVWDLQHGESNAAYKALLANNKASVQDTTSIFRRLAERPANADGQEDQRRFAQAQTVQHIHSLEVNVSDDRTTAAVKTNSQSGLKVQVPKIQQKQTKTMGNGLL